MPWIFGVFVLMLLISRKAWETNKLREENKALEQALTLAHNQLDHANSELARYKALPPYQRPAPTSEESNVLDMAARVDTTLKIPRFENDIAP